MNDKRGSTLYLIGELMSLSHAVFPGSKVIRMGKENDLQSLAFDDINAGLETITTSIYQKVVHLPHIHITKVISGRHHTHILTLEGRLLSFGSNSHGELCCGRIGNLFGDRSIKGLVHAEGIINEYKIIDGAAGGYHSIFLSSDGSVFVNGLNSTNQLGIPGENQTIPVKIPNEYFNNRIVTKVGANNTHSVFLTRDNMVYVAGSDSNGCCGGIKTSSVPLLLNFPSQFTPIDVSCGYDDTKFLTSQGRVLGCGCGSHGVSVIDELTGETTNLKYQSEENQNVIKLSNGYFCQSFMTSNSIIFGSASIKDEFLENFHSGDFDIYITKEFNPKTKGFGFIKKMDGTDLTGQFEFQDLSEKVEISSQRNHFIIHTYRDDFDQIQNHFIFFEKLMKMERKSLSDILIK